MSQYGLKLSTATAQEVFDHVVNHLRAQGRPCLNGSECLYRNEEGEACAAGCLIDDNDYTSDMEQTAWEDVSHEYDFPRVHTSLISDLQRAHDNWRFKQTSAIIEQSFSEIAKRYNLKVPV